MINARSREYASLRSPTDVVARLSAPRRLFSRRQRSSPGERKPIPTIFGERAHFPGLALGCIEADFCK